MWGTLPPLTRRVVAAIGVEAAVKLYTECGAREIRLPTVDAGGRLVSPSGGKVGSIVGAEAALALALALPELPILCVPMPKVLTRWQRDRDIRAMLETHPVHVVCHKYDLSPRQVAFIKSRSSEDFDGPPEAPDKPEQLSLI